MDRRDAFEKSWAVRHRVSIDEIRAHRFETEDGYDLPSLAAHYRTWCSSQPAWQPIDTAPQDGTEILLAAIGQTFDGVPLPPRVTLGHYTTGDELMRYAGDCGGACRCPEYEEITPFWLSWDGGFTEENPPTHWMPLPSAPEVAP